MNTVPAHKLAQQAKSAAALQRFIDSGGTVKQLDPGEGGNVITFRKAVESIPIGRPRKYDYNDIRTAFVIALKTAKSRRQAVLATAAAIGCGRTTVANSVKNVGV